MDQPQRDVVELYISKGRRAVYSSPEEQKEAKRKQARASYERNKAKSQALKQSMTTTQKQLIYMVNHHIYPDELLNAVISSLSKHDA
jgi:hypothetical protein